MGCKIDIGGGNFFDPAEYFGEDFDHRHPLAGAPPEIVAAAVDEMTRRALGKFTVRAAGRSATETPMKMSIADGV